MQRPTSQFGNRLKTDAKQTYGHLPSPLRTVKEQWRTLHVGHAENSGWTAGRPGFYRGI